jgi:hypothetical protein
MGKGVRRIPPAVNLIGERCVHVRWRCVDRGGVPQEKAGAGRFDHFAAPWPGEDHEKNRNGHNVRPASFGSSQMGSAMTKRVRDAVSS